MPALAATLAPRVNRALPPGFHARAAGRVLSLYGAEDSVSGEGNLRDVDLSLGRDDEDVASEAAVRAVLQVLGDFQDDVVESLRSAWPTAGGRAAPAPPFAEVSQGLLTLGYRYPDLTVIALEPIDLSELS